MADGEEALPPPPTYEEAQSIQISEPTHTSVEDNDDTPASMPLLGVSSGCGAATDSPNQNLGHLGVFPPSTAPVLTNAGVPSYTGAPSVATRGVSYATGTSDPTSIPIPPGYLPIITCHSCGAKQQIGQYSFLPKTQIVSMQAQVGAMNYFALAPTGPGMTAPTAPIAHGQRPGYPPSSGMTPQQQCNVAVHYNSNQGTVQSQPTTSPNNSETNEDGGTCCTTRACISLFCVFAISVICFFIFIPMVQ